MHRLANFTFAAVLALGLSTFWSNALAVGDLELLCDFRTVANHLIDGDLEKARFATVECEKIALRNQSKTFGPETLRGYYLATAQILTAQGNFDGARERIAKAVELPKTVLVPLDYLEETTQGYLLERLGQLDDAVHFYRRLDNPGAQIRLAKIYLDRGQTSDALETIRASIKASPNDPGAYAVLGQIFERSGSTNALDQYKTAMALAAQGNPSIVPLVYIEVHEAKVGIARLARKP